MLHSISFDSLLSCTDNPLTRVATRIPRFSHLGQRCRTNSRKRLVTRVFTGIVQGTAIVSSLDKKKDLTHFELQFPIDLSQEVVVGSSVAINGTCLTATSVQDKILTFDAIGETLSVTNLSELEIGSVVNYERAARFGDEIGGHTLSGHVHTIAIVSEILQTENNTKMTFQVEDPWMKYILSKGFVAVDGVSLTACEATEEGFSVHLCPETLRVTTLSTWKVGDRANIEVEAQTQAIVDTVERTLKTYLSSHTKYEIEHQNQD